MRRHKKYLLRNIVASGLLCAGLVSCSHDDMPDDGTLADGKYPLEFTASVEGMQSRASGKDVWTDGDEIGVRIGADGAVGRYRLNADGTVKEAVTPVYWQDTLSTYVKAWYPYAPQENVDISNQSRGFAAFDFLAVTAEGRNYTSSSDLILLHSMAKVSCTLQKGDGITDEDLAAATVRIAGYTKASFAEGELTGDGDGWITPASDGDALLVPQDMTGKPFVRVSFNGKTLTYTPDNETHGKLLAGYHNTYTFIVTADGIEVTAATGGEWTNGGSEDVDSKEVVGSYYIASDLKLGDYYYSDGTWSDGGLRTIYADGTTRWAEAMPQPESGKTVIGIVFYAGQHPNDNSDYSSTGIGSEKCHGYAVALQDAIDGSCMWGDSGTIGCCPTDASGKKQNGKRNPDIDWNGFDWTQKIITAAGGKDKLNATEEVGYPAAYYAVVDYESKFKAPANSSGWFLPSIGQMWNINKKRTSLFVGKDGTKDLEPNGWYWSSSEIDTGGNGALLADCNTGFAIVWTKHSNVCSVRPVLAF